MVTVSYTHLRFQHPVAGTYKKERLEAGKKYFSVASGGGTGRTLHPDNMAAGPASYGMTDTMAVSYTHLDVYKRQLLHSRKTLPSRSQINYRTTINKFKRGKTYEKNFRITTCYDFSNWNVWMFFWNFFG